MHDSVAAIDAAAWDDLLAASDAPTPFLRHDYLLALEASGSAVPDTGWSPQILLVRQGAALRAACVAYLKAHSYGEYVFDWSWADAWERAGHRYYPKLTLSVPFTPVPGSRLLARDAAGRRTLLAALRTLVARGKLSSAHLLFLSDADAEAAREAGWLMRSTVQFHWHNRSGPPGPYADFDDFLATLRHDKRKKIRQERRQVRDAGIQFEVRLGSAITAADWDHFYRCYRNTYAAHHSTPYLTRDFFARMAERMPGHWLMFAAQRDGETVARSLIALDPQQRVAYGRYWGATESIPLLHFEACYYQPLQWCIEQGWLRFEGGAQGEHKMSRGLLPVRTWSAHHLAHPAFEDAVARFLASEGAGIEAYVDELAERSPFRREATALDLGDAAGPGALSPQAPPPTTPEA